MEKIKTKTLESAGKKAINSHFTKSKIDNYLMPSEKGLHGNKGHARSFLLEPKWEDKTHNSNAIHCKDAFTLDVHITALFAMHAYTLESFKFDIHYAHLEHVLWKEMARKTKL